MLGVWEVSQGWGVYPDYDVSKWRFGGCPRGEQKFQREESRRFREAG
jgi:hypothetical protein